MELHTELPRLSIRGLKNELRRQEKCRSALLTSFPELEDGPPSLIAMYDTGHTKDNKWHIFAQLERQIDAIKLELFRRGKLSSSPSSHAGPKTGLEVNNETLGDDREPLKMRIGRNIQKLRKECGWSLAQLADKTGIDKKLILAHVNGKSKPNPRTLREYAQAFTKELKRSIIANSLEE